MQKSIAAKYAARPAARFARPVGQGRERRLGLHTVMAFQPAPRFTILRSSRKGLSVGQWRPIATPGSLGATWRISHPVRVRWVAPGRSVSIRQANPAAAPWRG